MSRYLTILICFLMTLLSSTYLRANETSLQLLGPREGHPSSIVDGVSTITGDYSELEVDLVVPGPDTLNLSRLYSSGDHPASNNFGGWRFLSKCLLSVEKDPKGKTYSTSEGKFDRTYVRVGTDEGSILTYVGWQNTSNGNSRSLFKLDVDDRVFSMANNARGNPHSWTNQKNNELYYQADGDTFEQSLCNLGKRVYFKHPSKNFYCLEKEILPSGNKIFYEYDEQARPTFIKLVNSREEKVLAWIKIQYGQITRVETSDKKAIEYQFEQDGSNRPLLTKVVSSHKPSVEYQYNQAEKHPLLIRKLLPGGRSTEIEYLTDSDGKNRVHTFTKPVLDGLIARTEFTYEFERDGSGYTQVHGPSGEKSVHRYNEDFQLTSIEEYLNGSLYRTQRNLWGYKRDACNLLQSSIEDGFGNVYFAKTYAYDDQGNVLHEKEYGNLTGAHPEPLMMNGDGTVDECQEAHGKSYSYSQVDDVDVVNQTDMKGSGIRYCYKKGTNLLLKKYILQKDKRKKRWFYDYNEDGALTQILIDDGDESTPKDTYYLKKRLITKITPKAELPSVGAPEIIEEKYLNIKGKQEVLIKRTVNHFDVQGNIVLQEIHDANEEHRYSLKKSYENGLLIMETDPLGNETHYTYDEVHNLIQETSTATGSSTRYGYDLENRLIYTAEEAAGHTFETSVSYNASGYKTSETDRFGNVTRFSVDELGRTKTITYPEIGAESHGSIAPTYSYEHDLFDHVSQVIDPYGSITSKSSTPGGSPVRIEYPDGVQEFFKYDLEGSLHRHCGRDGLIRVFEYDFMGRLNHIEYYQRGSTGSRDGFKRNYCSYNAFHLTSTEDENGNKTTYSYDGAGRLISTTTGSQKADLSYDALGRVAEVKKWKSKDTCTLEKKEYDLAGNVTSLTVEDETGKVLTKTEYSYDNAGRLIEVIGYPQNKRTCLKHFEYDLVGRLVRETDTQGLSTEIVYEDGFVNEWGQRVLKKVTIDPLGNTTEEVFDVLDNLVSTIKKDASGKRLSSTHRFFDAYGNKTSQHAAVIDPAGKTKSYVLRKTYLPGSHLAEVHVAADSSEERVTQFTYNNYGDLSTKQESGESSPITYEYNNKGDLVKMLYQEEGDKKESCHEIEYDKKGNVTKANVNSKLSVRYKFDANDQLIEETVKDAFGSYAVKSSYDGEGCLTEIELPDGSFIQYDYEGPFVQRVVRVAKDKQETYQHKIFSRDLMGNILEEILPYHAGSRKLSLDSSGRIMQIATDFFSDTIPGQGYDPLGNIKTRKALYDGEEWNISYTYDALNQLLSEKGEIEHTYSFDSIGNLLNKDGSSFVVNDANQLTEADGATYTFDAKGNLATKTLGGKVWEFKHNRLNQLVFITLPDQTTISFTYDLVGKRLSKKVEGNGTSEIFRYFYLKDTELGSMDSKGNIVQLRVPSNPNQPERESFIAFELYKEMYVPIYDIQGNVACLVDPERRKIQESYRYSAFGEEGIYNHRDRKINQSNVNNPWRYRGNRIDEETHLMYIGHRYYDSEISRWISPDPAGDLDGPNLYVYCRNNPLTYVDYFGLASEKSKGPVDESYFYGEYEPHCYCERHRDCKRGGDIATNPTLRAGVSIGSVVDLSLEVLSHPRVQGSMQAFAGLAEASAGGLATFGTGGLAAPVGWPVLVHGLDQFITGMGTVITGKHRTTLTEQLLQTTGMSSEWASFTNDVLTIGGTMGGSAIIRASRLRVFPRYFLPTSTSPTVSAYDRFAFEKYKTLLRAQMEKPYVVNPRLQEYVDLVYKPHASIGSGSTAAAIRHELATGGKVFGRLHSKKGGDMINALEKWLRNNPTARPGDRAAAENIIKDLRNALGE